MNVARRRVLIALAVGVVAMLGALAGRLLGKKRPRFLYALGSLSGPDYSALAAKPGWAATSAEMGQGVTLRGLIRRPASAEAPWVWFIHGNDPAQLATGQKFLERLRQERDWGLAVFPYRGFDSSPGTPTPEDLVADARKILRGLCEKEKLQPAQLHLVAFSLGGYLAAQLVGEAAREQKRLASLSLLASVEDIEMVRPSWAAKLDPGDHYDIKPLLDSVPAPVVVVHGTADEALGAEQGRVIAARLGTRAKFVELSGAGHVALLEMEPAFAAVRQLIESSRPP